MRTQQQNLQNDPDEMSNVYDAPAYQQVVAETQRLLRDIKDKIGDSDHRYPELTACKDNLYYAEEQTTPLIM